MIEDFFIPLFAIAVAECGDKTQLSLFLLSSKTDKRVQLLLGAFLGFLFLDGMAVLLGSYISSLVPIFYIKILSSTIFIFFGFLIFTMDENNKYKFNKGNGIFLSGFLLISLTEFGDKSQIAVGMFSMNFNPVMVFLGSMTSLTLLSIVAIFFGKFVSERVDKKLMKKISAVVFVLMGILIFVS